MRSGFITITGRPNVGKSTLLNKLINKKLAITSDKAGTTRNNIYGIYNDDDTQIVFVDTPGIGKTTNKLSDILNKKAFSAVDNDLILFLIDCSYGFGKNDEKILDRLKKDNKDVILVLSKSDLITKDQLFSLILNTKDKYNFLDIVPISSKKNDNIIELINVIKKYLKDDIKYFEDDVITNVTEEFMISEMIREKVLWLFNKEVPHSVACIIEKLEFKKNVCNINALLVVDRKNLKKIIIGKNGSMIKEIGSLSRKDIEDFLNKKVYLNLFVKVIDDWRDKDKDLKDLKITELE